MAAFVIMGKWTEKGVQNMKEAGTRAQAARQLAESLGGRIIGIWWTMGKYDFISITEFPDDETFARFALTSSLGGHFTTTSARAFGEDEMQELLKTLP